MVDIKFENNYDLIFMLIMIFIHDFLHDFNIVNFSDRLSTIRGIIADFTAIVSGELRPGQTLHESDLTKQFGASRSPIREALVQLEQEGLVITIPKKGSVITTIDKGQLRQALFIRSSLEATNIELLAQNISDLQMRTIKDNIERQRTALLNDDYTEMYESMDEFHLLLCDFNQLPRIWEIIRREKIPLDRLHALNQPHSPRMATLFNQHIEIVKALEEKDSEKCSTLIRMHADIFELL
jgi:DNA-binding GntR family transcriptional regulator